jgi:hypothetical protein
VSPLNLPGVSSPTLWIPAGNWAEWAGSVLAGLSLILLVVGLHREREARRKDEAERRAERRREQAQHTAVWMRVTGGGGTRTDTGLVADVTISVVNTGDQPLYNCWASSILDVAGVTRVDQWQIGTLSPHGREDRPTHFDVDPSIDVNNIDNTQLVAEVMFTDGNAVSWVRTHFGLLLETSDPMWSSRIHLSTLERSKQLRRLWNDEQRRERRI